MYIICCHSLCVLLFFSQDYQRVPLLNFSEKYLGESLGSGVTGSHCWLASFFAISMRIGGFDVPQQVTNCEVFCEMSRIGHDVGIWWYLMVFVLCTSKQDHHFGINVGLGTQVALGSETEAVNVLTSLRLHAPGRLMGLVLAWGKPCGSALLC